MRCGSFAARYYAEGIELNTSSATRGRDLARKKDKPGSISWREDGGWFQSELPVVFPVFRQAIRIMAWTEGETAAQPGVLTSAHLAAIDGLMTVAPARRDEWSAAVFADFREAVESGQCELRSNDIPKRCRAPEDVWPLVEWSEVVVPDQGPKGDRFILVHGHPGWRIEHGLQLLLKNELLLWVGRADVALFMDSDWSHDYLPYYLPRERKRRRK